MFGTRRFPKTPILEYQVQRRPEQLVIAFKEEFGLESAEHLAKCYKIIKEQALIEEYIDLSNPENLLDIASDFLDEDLLNSLMNIDMGQGMILGYLWACIDWSQGLRDVEEKR